MAGCSIEGCARPRKTRGWCGTHYERWRVHGDPAHETWTKVCTVEGCEKPHKASGYCSMHSERWQRTGDAGAAAPTRVRRYEPTARCAVEGCDGEVKARGWCVMHYARWKDYGDPSIVRFPKADRVADCIACGKPTAHGMRQFCSTACRAFVARAGVQSRDTCITCAGALPVTVTASGMRQRGNGRGYCLICAEVAPCAQCGEPRKRSGSSLVCRPCRRPTAVADAQMRRARKVGAVCEHGERCVTAKVIKEIRVGRCLYCDQDAEHADHFEPLASGGKHCRENLVPACARCNLTKSDSDPWQWWERRGVAV